MASLLIAESGSTKTDWRLIIDGKITELFKTSGMNPWLQITEEATALLNKELAAHPKATSVEKVIFYGAGVRGNIASEKMYQILKRVFLNTDIAIHSDLMAAAHATCGNDKGVVCILGTGSNSGYYNGKIIKYQNPSLGYVVGDEGSGAFLGKRVLQYFFYNTFDDELSVAFKRNYGDDLSTFLENIYRKPFANRYLASFVPFLKAHRGHYMIENILEDAFIDFHQRHVLKYRESWTYPIHFCGSVAYEFRDVIENLQEQYGLTTGKIIKAPMNALCAFHLSQKVPQL